MMKSTAFSALCAALLLPAAAVADDYVGASDKGKSNPNKIVCRSQESTGSRLSQVKRCMTLAEWAQEKQVSRQEIERIQTNRYKNN